MTDHKIRAGDHVRHKPSGETWVVLWADHSTGYMAPAGWPPSEAKIADCELDRAATDNEHGELLDRLVVSLERGDNFPAGAKAVRMYRPEYIPGAALADEVKREAHRLRAGDLVRFPEPQTNDPRESMVVYADYATGWLAPACAGDSWEIQISAVELVTAATDEVHNGVLDRFARLISKGIELKAGARALEIYRPATTPAASEEAQIVGDLAKEAGKRATKAAMDVARLIDPRDAGSIMYGAAFKMVLTAAASFAALKHGNVLRACDFTDPETVAIVHAMADAFKLFPDTVAMDKQFAQAIGAELMS